MSVPKLYRLPTDLESFLLTEAGAWNYNAGVRIAAGPSQPAPMGDHPRDECGVVGVYAPGGDASRLAFFGLFALQHRGQESAGIAASNGRSVKVHSDMGLVTQIFREEELLSMAGAMAIGHTRYSTTGSSNAANASPFLVKGVHGELALGHNGNIVNAAEIQGKLKEQWGCGFNSTTDSEVVAHLLANAPGLTWEERISHCMRTLEGAFAAVALTRDTLIGIRDPLGIRPLCIGKLDGGWVIASESCALDHLGATFLRELEPGEAVLINKKGLRSFIWPGAEGRRALCVFELIYFARPDSILDNKLVYTSRRDMGAQLAREHPAEADVVIGVPDSATAAAIGYAQESGIPYSDGLVRNRYVGRTFIEPDQRLRDLGVRVKFNPLPGAISGKRVVIVDDSIVRATTTPHVLGLLRKAGAREVHMRVCAPPIRHPCHLGVDMATKKELIATNRTEAEVQEFIGADSLGYLSVRGLLKVVGGTGGGFCDACFTGNFPIPIQLEMDKLVLEHSQDAS